MKYYRVPKELLIDRKNFSNDMEDVLVINQQVREKICSVQ